VAQDRTNANFLNVVSHDGRGQKGSVGGRREGKTTPSRAETELTKNGVSGTKIDQPKPITTIGDIVVFPVCTVNIPKVG
jgi:hypothetical protein